MNTYLTDSMARDHLRTIEASAQASRRAREARLARREARRAARRTADDGTGAGSTGAGSTASQHPRAAAVGHVAVRPFTAVHSWLVAGQL